MLDATEGLTSVITSIVIKMIACAVRKILYSVLNLKLKHMEIT